MRDFRKNGKQNTHTGNSEIDRNRILNFLMNGTEADIEQFIDQLLQNAGEDVSLPLFCRYLTMTVCYSVADYLDSIGCRREDYKLLERRMDDSAPNPEVARKSARQAMTQAIALRDSESKKQQSNLLKQAIGFMDTHYPEESISLDRVARQINISPNYFSAMFSQEIGQTFVEYLTGKRIGEAKRMLRQSDMRASEIAAAVGYKDPHYFSFVFRKVAGCTPSEYRRSSRLCV